MPYTMALSVGTKLGPYEVVARIGAGGMGEVYRARDTRLNRDVALKVLPEIFAKDPQRMGRFEREARLLASLNHPNIAAIYGLEESGPIRALVMELVEGPTLADRIAAGPMPLDEALPVARQIAEAVEYAHDNNVIHRDLKPANIKVKADGAVKVLDFGLAKALSDEPSEAEMANSPTLSMAATMQGVILGTAAYMAPEQAKGKRVDRRADIWAFGVVLYEMLTGKMAFRRRYRSTDTLAAVIQSGAGLVAAAGRDTACRCGCFCAAACKKTSVNDCRRSETRASGWMQFSPACLMRRSQALHQQSQVTGAARFRGPSGALPPWQALVLLLTLIAIVNAPPASGPLVWKQITFSTDHKSGPIITDGTRLYFHSQDGPVEMSVNGGPTSVSASFRRRHEDDGHFSRWIRNAVVEA